MATVLGSGTALACLMAAPSVARTPEAPPPPPAPRAEAPVDSPETLDLLARIAWVLGDARGGMTVTELRVALSEKTDVVQKALFAGVRSRRLRRLGSRNQLRYVVNL
jgi:hypothetical protein